MVFSDGGITLDEMGFCGASGACSLEMLFKAGLHMSACLTNIASNLVHISCNICVQQLIPPCSLGSQEHYVAEANQLFLDCSYQLPCVLDFVL